MELRAYLDVTRRWWWTLVAATWVAGVVAFGVASQLPKVYDAQERLLVGPVNTDYNTLRAAGGLVQTYTQLLKSDPVLERAISELNLDTTPRDLRNLVDTSGSDTTRIITVSASWSDPNTAAAIVSELSQGLIDLSTKGISRPEGALTVAQPAAAALTPSAPQVSLIVLFAAAAGFSGALLLVLLLEHLSDTVKGAYELQQLDTPFLGVIKRARYTPTPTDPLVAEALPTSRTTEQYRLLATRIRAHEESLSQIVVLGAEPDDGSAEVAANLAAVLGRAGRKVRLIEAEEESEEIARLFGLVEQDGMDRVLAGTALPGVEVRRPPNIGILTSGRDPVAVDRNTVRTILSAAKSKDHFVIVHTSPLHMSSGALLWLQASQASLLVVNRGLTLRRHLDYAIETVRQTQSDLVGTILIEPPTGLPWRREQPRRSQETEGRNTVLVAGDDKPRRPAS